MLFLTLFFDRRMSRLPEMSSDNIPNSNPHDELSSSSERQRSIDWSNDEQLLVDEAESSPSDDCLFQFNDSIAEEEGSEVTEISKTQLLDPNFFAMKELSSPEAVSFDKMVSIVRQHQVISNLQWFLNMEEEEQINFLSKVER